MNSKITINYEIEHQTMEGFGVSGAWWAQLVGLWTHIDKESGIPIRERIAELLFDKDKGLGIDIYRYNLGGGSVESGKGKFNNPIRRAECFLDADGKYDMSKDAAAVWFMKQAVKLGVSEVIFFVNSPTENLTINGKTQCEKAGRENLDSSNYKAFADYCLDVTQYFLKQGIPIKYISPVNEPLWVWTHSQEGCHYKARSVRNVLEVFAREIEDREELKSANLKIGGAENGDIRWFNKTYALALLKSPIIKRNIDSIDTHSYWVSPINNKFISKLLDIPRVYTKRKYGNWMRKKYPDIKLKTTEWTHMKSGRDYSIMSAIEQARVMYEDINFMNIVSFQLWIAVSDVDYCDGLIYIDKKNKTYDIPKRYYGYGNFTKFIPYGAVRVHCQSSDKKLLSLCFKKDKQLITILVNTANTDYNCFINAGNAEIDAAMYITSEKHNLDKIDVKLNSLSIPKLSICTIITQIKE